MAKSTRKLMKSFFCRPNHEKGHLMETRRHVRILWVVGNWENYGEKYQRTNPFFFVDQTTGKLSDRCE